VKQTALVRRTGLKRNTKLRIAGKSDVAETKRNIQALLRDIVIKRDGGCVLRSFAIEYPYGPLSECNGYAKDGHLILQADHLIRRSNAATYADSRLVVCLCKGHHGCKSLGSNLCKKQYDAIVRQLLSPERVKLWDAYERDSCKPVRTGAYDWRLAEAALKAELNESAVN
jgi:hypothetical protein